MGNIRVWLDTMNTEKQEYALKYTPKHLAQAGYVNQLFGCLTSFEFIQAKLLICGVEALIEDYELGLNTANIILSEAQTETFRLIQGAIRLCSHILKADQTQLAGQLLGRLLEFENPLIQNFLEDIKINQTTPWLCPLEGSLTKPDSPLLRTLVGHTDEILALEVTPDSQWLISGSKDHTIKVWDIATGQEIYTLTGHTGSVLTLVLTSDGKQVISGSADHTIKVWSLETGQEIYTLRGHTDSVFDLALRSDNQVLFSVAKDNTIKLWNLEKREASYSCKEIELINSLLLIDDGYSLITTHNNNIFVLWLVTDQLELVRAYGYLTAINESNDKIETIQIDLSERINIEYIDSVFKRINNQICKQESDLLVSITINKAINLPKSEKILLIITIQGSGSYYLVSFDFLTETHDIYNIVYDYQEIKNLGNTIAFEDKNILIYGIKDLLSDSSYLEGLNLENKKQIFTLSDNSLGKNYILSPKNENLITTTKENKIKIWDFEQIKNVNTQIEYSNKLVFMQVSNNGKWLLTMDFDDGWDRISLYYQIKVYKINQLELDNPETYSCYKYAKFSFDNNYIVLGTNYCSELYEISVYSLIDQNIIFTIETETNNDRYMCVDLQDNYLIFTDFKQIKVFNFIENKKIAEIVEHSFPFMLHYFIDMKVSQDTKNIVTISKNQDLKVWDLNSGQLRWYSDKHSLIEKIDQGKSSIILAYILAISNDSRYLVTGYHSSLSDAVIWDLEQGEEKLNPSGQFLGITPDSQAIVMQLNSELQILDIETGQINTSILDDNISSISFIKFTSDSQKIIASFKNKLIGIWDLKTGCLIQYFNNRVPNKNLIAITRDNQKIISVYDFSVLTVCDINTGKTISSFTADSSLTCFDITPDSTKILAGDESGKLHFLTLEDRE